MIKVLFIAKIKDLNEEYKSMEAKLLDAASSIDGYVDIETEVKDDIEITISTWENKKAVDKWSKDPIHIKAKERVNEWYHWVKGIHMEVKDE